MALRARCPHVSVFMVRSPTSWTICLDILRGLSTQPFNDRVVVDLSIPVTATSLTSQVFSLYYPTARESETCF